MRLDLYPNILTIKLLLTQGSKYLIDRSSISPLAYQALTQISVPNSTLSLNMPNLAQAAGISPVLPSASTSLGSNQLFTVTPKTNQLSIENLLALGKSFDIFWLFNLFIRGLASSNIYDRSCGSYMCLGLLFYIYVYCLEFW